MAARDAVVRAHARDLLPTALLLTGDGAAARQLVVATLARRRGRPAAAADHHDAVAALVRTHRRRWRTGEARLTAQLPAPWWAAPQDVAEGRALADALDALDRDERTAAVLRWFDDWRPEQVTALLPAVDLDALAARLPPDLPRRLDGLAALTATPDADDDTLVAEVGRTATGRTRRAALAVAGTAALAAAAVWVPGAATGPAAPSPGTSTAGPTRTPEPVPPRGIYALTPRGSLVDDGLLGRVQDRLAVEGIAGGRFRVVYGEDVDGVRVVLAAPSAAGATGLAWLTGPAGTDPADLEVTRADGSGPAGETAAAVTVRRPGLDGFVLVAVVADGVTVRVSPGIDVDPATGAAGRTFVELPSSGGAVTGLVDRSSDSGVQLQVIGAPVAVQVQPTSAGSRPPVEDRSQRVPSRSGAATASTDVVGAAVSTVAAATGWGPPDVDVVVLGSGVLTGPEGHIAQAVSVAVVLPSGAVVTTTTVLATWTGTDVDGTTTSSSTATCGSSGHPAGTDLASLVVAATCTFPDAAGDPTRVAVVSAPPGDRVVLDFAGGDPPLEPPLTDGFGVVADLPARGLATATTGSSVVPVAGPGQDVLAG